MANSQLDICQVVASINENTGGTAIAVTSLAEALAKQGVRSHIFTLNYRQCGNQIESNDVKIHSYNAGFWTSNLRGFNLNVNQALYQLSSHKFDLIHNHGLWMFPNLYARCAAVGNNLPLVTSPRGMLESWSLKHSRMRKWLAWFLYEAENLKMANLFHATSIEEFQSIRHLNFQQPTALISDAVRVPSLIAIPNREKICQDFPELIDKSWLVFLSRIHPKKGLNNLLNVWAKLVNFFPEWHLIIAGPNQIGYQAKLESLTADLGLEKRVTFTGMLTGEKKAAALGNADLFVLPTHSENFGIAVAEALAHAIPVVTTKEAPWQDLSTYECGWWIDNNQDALAHALAEGMQLSSKERQVMGLKGRNLVETKYSWDSIAKKMLSVYQWILGHGDPPSCIQFDVSR